MRNLMILALVSLLTVPLTNTANAGGDRIRLEAEVGAKDGPSARVRFESRGDRMKFNISVDDGPANTSVSVWVDGQEWVVDLDAFGSGTVDLDTGEGDADVPALVAGDTIRFAGFTAALAE